MSRYFPGVEPRIAEKLEHESKLLSAGLAKSLGQVDNYAMRSARSADDKAGVPIIMTRWGPVSYMLTTVAQKTRKAGDVWVTEPVPERYRLMGVLRKDATIEQHAQFPLVLRRVALLLGAVDNESLWLFENDIRDGEMGLGTGAVAGGDAGDEKISAQAKLVRQTAEGSATKAEVLRGAAAKSFTYSWPAKQVA